MTGGGTRPRRFVCGRRSRDGSGGLRPGLIVVVVVVLFLFLFLCHYHHHHFRCASRNGGDRATEPVRVPKGAGTGAPAQPMILSISVNTVYRGWAGHLPCPGGLRRRLCRLAPAQVPLDKERRSRRQGLIRVP